MRLVRAFARHSAAVMHGQTNAKKRMRKASRLEGANISNTNQYVDLRQQGLTFQQIANKFGVTRQAVHYAVKRREQSFDGAKTPYSYRGINDVKYRGLREWLINNHCSVHKLERMCGRCVGAGLKNGSISKRSVDAILGVTGLTYDEAFNVG